jgi:anti-sigma factor RsiW
MSNGLTDEKLIAFAAGELDELEAARVRQHLGSDTVARETVNLFLALRRTLATDDSVVPPDSVIARAKAIFKPQSVGQSGLATSLASWLEAVDRAVASLLFDSRVQPALGFRGASQAVRLAFDSGEAEVDLELSGPDDSANDGLCRVTGQISVDPSADAARGPHPVALVEPGTTRAVAETRSDEHGVFSLRVAPGRYDLCVQVGSRVIVAPEVQVE